jgi:hypothetical protein
MVGDDGDEVAGGFAQFEAFVFARHSFDGCRLEAEFDESAVRCVKVFDHEIERSFTHFHPVTRHRYDL